MTGSQRLSREEFQRRLKELRAVAPEDVMLVTRSRRVHVKLNRQWREKRARAPQEQIQAQPSL